MTTAKFRRRKEARPGEIVEAALALFSAKGFAATRLDEIAARAGVSKGALYLYFATKEDLFRAVVTRAVAPDLERVGAFVRAHQGSFAELLATVVRLFARTAATGSIGPMAKTVISESRNFPELARHWHDTVVMPMLSLMAGAIARAQANGEVRPGDPRLYALQVASPVLMGMLWRETFVPGGAEPLDLGELAEQHVRTLLHGLAQQPDAAP
ncbi:MAG: TetR/AcrR family transcriptional regulator [Geminicoccaceae bacterium]